jgi:hypothetical protein
MFVTCMLLQPELSGRRFLRIAALSGVGRVPHAKIDFVYPSMGLMLASQMTNQQKINS